MPKAVTCQRLLQKGKAKAAPPEPDPVPVTPPEPEEPEFAPPTLEYVCCAATIPLQKLVKGDICLNFDSNLLPISTVGACSGLSWNMRPGLYMQAQSYLEGSIRYGLPM
jgi:hypothetical protein